MEAIDRTRHDRRSQLVILVLGVFLARRTAPVAAQSNSDLFEQYEIVLGSARHQTVLSGFLFGGAYADLAVVHIDEDNDRRLRIYEFVDGTWVAGLDTTLRPGVLFVDVAKIGGHDRLITYESGRLNWFDPDSPTERVLMRIGSNYRATNEGQIPHVDITRDLNRDGLDDLVMPDVDGFWISTQRSNGSFTDFVKLGPPEPFAQDSVGNLDVGEPASGAPRSYGEVGITAMTIPVYLSRVHEMDYDQDGRSDLVFWNEDQFDVHLQDSRGQFSRVAETFTPDVPFGSDGAYSRAFEYSDQGMFSLLLGLGEKTKRRVLHSLRDLNSDGVADLVALTLTGRSITRQRSLYEVHFGTETPDGTVFARDVGTAIHPQGRAGGLQPWGYSSQWFQDFDGDGQVDVVFRDVNVGIGGIARALTGNSVPINLEFYRNRDGIYPDEPTTKRKIRRFAPLDGPGNIFFPAVLMGDVNGDGRSDLLVGQSPVELHVFLGVPGPGLLARQPLRVAVTLPSDERNTWLVDLDLDGKQDLLVHRPSTTEPHRLTILIAR